MDLRSNNPFWPIKNSFAVSYPSLKGDIESEIIIVGGGITGALVAHELISKGFNVVLVDKRDIGHGSTAASTAMLQYEIDVPLHKLIEKVGLTVAVSSYKNCEKAIDSIEAIVNKIKSNCDFERKESVYFTSNKKDVSFLKKEYESRKEHGLKVKWLEKDQVNTLGIVNGYAAIVSKSAAVMDPFKFAIDLLKYLEKKGLKIYDKTEIISSKKGNQHTVLTTESGATITGSHIIYCTGYESESIMPKDVVQLKSTYAFISEALDSTPKPFVDKIYWDTSTPYLYFRATNDHRIIVGGGDENFKNAALRDKLLKKKIKQLKAAFINCFPNIDLTVDYGWAGTFGETKDGLPYMGKPDPAKNDHFILGFGGNGITFSMMGTEAIISSIESRPHTYLEYYKFER